MKTKIQTRDLIAVPVWALALKLDMLALKIGGEWTAQMFLDERNKISKKLNVCWTAIQKRIKD